MQDLKFDAGARLERVYRERGVRLWRALYAYSGSREIADDAVAEAFTQALRRGAAIRDPERWIWRAAFKIASGELQGRWYPLVGLSPDATYELPEVASILSVLARLSPKQRACLVLYHYLGYPTKDIAEMVGASAAAVRVHLVRGRRRLRQIMEEEDASER